MGNTLSIIIAFVALGFSLISTIVSIIGQRLSKQNYQKSFYPSIIITYEPKSRTLLKNVGRGTAHTVVLNAWSKVNNEYNMNHVITYDSIENGGVEQVPTLYIEELQLELCESYVEINYKNEEDPFL